MTHLQQLTHDSDATNQNSMFLAVLSTLWQEPDNCVETNQNSKVPCHPLHCLTRTRRRCGT